MEKAKDQLQVYQMSLPRRQTQRTPLPRDIHRYLLAPQQQLPPPLRQYTLYLCLLHGHKHIRTALAITI